MSAIQAPPQPPLGPPPQSPSGLATLVQRHQAGVWRYLRFLGAKWSEAEDLTQETFLAFIRARFVERDARQTAAYLRTVARNQLLALRHSQKREIASVELEAAESVWARVAGEDGSLNSYLDALRECVEQLIGRPRQAVELPLRPGQPGGDRRGARNETRRRQFAPAPHPRPASQVRQRKINTENP